MSKTAVERAQHKPLVRRFWREARGFWSSPRSWKVAWLMTACLILLVIAQLFFSYQLNIWNKAIFDALEKKDGATVLRQAIIFVPLAAGSIAVAICIVYARMRTQRRWRAWLTEHTIPSQWREKLSPAEKAEHGFTDLGTGARASAIVPSLVALALFAVVTGGFAVARANRVVHAQ